MAADYSNTVMRTVSFVERIEVEFHGNVVTQAMVLEDVDNDLGNELVVGNIDGQISIFKGDSSHAWRKASVSGMLTCLAVGKVHLPKKNSLVCMTAEGWCYLFDVTAQPSMQSMLGTDEEPTDHRVIKPVFSQELPANARVMCLADIDSDGHIEMVIGYSDRVVRAFRWHEMPSLDTGQFVLLQKWQLAGQIGSITINYDRDQQPELMVSQPGATFVTLQVKPAFRHIKSDSHLDRLCGSNAAHSSRTNIERSGSFAAATTGGSKGGDSPRVDNNSGNFSPRAGTTYLNRGVPRRSEPCASKSDTHSPRGRPANYDSLAASSSSMDHIVSPRDMATKPQRNAAEHVVKSAREMLLGGGISESDINNIITPGDAVPVNNKSTTSTSNSHGLKPPLTRVCKSESSSDHVPDQHASRLLLLGNSGSGENAPDNSNPLIIGDKSMLSHAPLALKTSLDGVVDSMETSGVFPHGLQGSPRPSNTTNSSPLDPHEGHLERSLGRMNQFLDGSFDDDVFKPSIMYHPLAYMQMRNKDTSTVIVGGIKQGRRTSSGSYEEYKPRATYYALATLDGSLILVENDSILWSLQVDHHLFALSKLDVTGNGKEEVVCCSWNGQTYIVNHSKEIVRYQFPNSVAAFCAGYFSLRDGQNSPCFVYAGFNNRIYIYPNIALPRVESTNLLKVMNRLEESSSLLRQLNIAEDDVDSVRRLFYYCLYGQPGRKASCI